MTDWADPLVVTGPTATGRYYFNRPDLELEIWKELAKGANVLLAAPRRVGKSSVMQAMELTPIDGTKAIFRNIQGVKSEAEFYKTMFELLLLCLDKYGKGLVWLNQFVKGINIEEITLDGVKFGDKKSLNYEEELDRLFTKLASMPVKVVLLIDELPEVLNNLYKGGKLEEASNILNKMRQWRQTPALREKVGMVLAGSVGIHHIVKLIEGRIADINDFAIVPFKPLTRAEAERYVKWATEKATVQYEGGTLDYLLDKLQYFIPYFISLMLDHVNRLSKSSGERSANQETIDAAFNAVVKNNENFSEWGNRLSTYFSKQEAGFLHEVLARVAAQGSLQGRTVYDIARKHDLSQNYMELMRGLERDGYLQIDDDSGEARFISPFLQAFWKRNYPFYE